MSIPPHNELFQHGQDVFSSAECLFSSSEVAQAIEQLAKEISSRLKDSYPIVLCVMNGGLIPCGLLLPRLEIPLQIDYIHATRYGQETTGSQLKWLATPNTPLKGRNILLIDDIHDEGITLKMLVEYCYQQQAEKVYSCTLIYKQHQRKHSDTPDFIGLTVPDRYVFGYGMDYKSLLRNSPGIYAVKD